MEVDLLVKLQCVQVFVNVKYPYFFLGTSVFTVTAHDYSLLGKSLKYRIISENEAIFYIHPITGKSVYLHLF